VRAGALGQVFHYESFVGGYGHPCNYWHSDEAVSGGAIYDWGSHYLDWVLDCSTPRSSGCRPRRTSGSGTTSPTPTTPACLVHFARRGGGGVSPTPTCRARKPKFYVLGTAAGLIGDWRTESVLAARRSARCTRTAYAPSDAPAALRLLHPDGGRASETRVSLPPPPPSRSTASWPTRS
jgi:predicted dehydrogenase